MISRSAFEALLSEGRALAAARDFDAAKERFELALAEGESTWGALAPELIGPLWNLAGIARQAGMTSVEPSAPHEIPLLRRAMTIADCTTPHEAIEHVKLRGALGISLYGTGELEDSAAFLNEALDRLSTRDEGRRRFLLGALIPVLLDLKRADDALSATRELLQLATSPNVPRIFLFEAWYWMGCGLVAAGRASEAIPYFQQCVDYRERHYSGSPKNAEFIELLADARTKASCP